LVNVINQRKNKMSRETSDGLAYIVMGAITASGVGQFLFQAIGALILGIMGAVGGYLFNRFLRPKFDALLNKNKQKNQKKAE